ncbi:hypothetical protein EYC84_007279 [Monilinia fructicola]|uniref:Uncharacterized protein n=1 Tax=Monilinia fructicola TaxID=38448 RepID=A0A5M9K9W9_MONFR|nr:hypothetical protein EYC84_007279 [Monilinia fructicola]
MLFIFRTELGAYLQILAICQRHQDFVNPDDQCFFFSGCDVSLRSFSSQLLVFLTYGLNAQVSAHENAYSPPRTHRASTVAQRVSHFVISFQAFTIWGACVLCGGVLFWFRYPSDFLHPNVVIAK